MIRADILFQAIENLYPEHGGEPGSAGLMFWGILFVVIGGALLIGSVLLVLSTDIGFKRAFWATCAVVSGYMFLHSLTWILSGNGPRGEGSGFWNHRWQGGIAIGGVALVAFIAICVVWHITERKQQRAELG